MKGMKLMAELMAAEKAGQEGYEMILRKILDELILIRKELKHAQKNKLKEGGDRNGRICTD